MLLSCCCSSSCRVLFALVAERSQTSPSELRAATSCRAAHQVADERLALVLRPAQVLDLVAMAHHGDPQAAIAWRHQRELCGHTARATTNECCGVLSPRCVPAGPGRAWPQVLRRPLGPLATRPRRAGRPSVAAGAPESSEHCMPDSTALLDTAISGRWATGALRRAEPRAEVKGAGVLSVSIFEAAGGDLPNKLLRCTHEPAEGRRSCSRRTHGRTRRFT